MDFSLSLPADYSVHIRPARGEDNPDGPRRDDAVAHGKGALLGVSVTDIAP